MSEENKPWYHGVKWHHDTTTSQSGTYVIAPEGEVVYLPNSFRHYAELLAAAPETAQQRDELLKLIKARFEVVRADIRHFHGDERAREFLMSEESSLRELIAKCEGAA